MNYKESSSSSDALKCSQCEQKCNSYAFPIIIYIYFVIKSELNRLIVFDVEINFSLDILKIETCMLISVRIIHYWISVDG